MIHAADCLYDQAAKCTSTNSIITLYANFQRYLSKYILTNNYIILHSINAFNYYNNHHPINALLICVTKPNLLNTLVTLVFVSLVGIKIGTIWFIAHTMHQSLALNTSGISDLQDEMSLINALRFLSEDPPLPIAL